MAHSAHSPLERLLIAFAAIVIAVAARWGLEPWYQGNVPFITMFAATAFVAWYVGTGAALLTAMVGGAICAIAFLPSGVFDDAGTAGMLILLVYLAVSLLIVLLGEYAHRRGEQAEQALLEMRSLEGQMRLFVDTLPMLVSYIDHDLCYRFNNLAYQRWFGADVSSLRGRRVDDLLGPSAFAAVMPSMHKALAGETVQFETRIDYQTAGERQVSITYAPHRVGSRVMGFLALVDDVTEKRSAEHSRAHLAAIFESASDAVVSKDLEGRVTSWNSGAEQLFGYSAEEMTGTSISRIIPEDLQAEERLILEQIRAGERVEHMETERLHRSGRRIPMSVTISPIRDSSGRIIGASTIARDNTQRHAAMHALQQSEARFQRLADNAPMMIWQVDADNCGIWFNRAWLDFTGSDLTQLVGSGWTQALHRDDRERVIEQRLAHAALREPFETEYRMLRRDGKYQWMYDRGAPMFEGENNRFTGFIGSAVDISDRKQAIAELSRAARRKDEFLATLAHELRNPLAPILTAAQLMQRASTLDPALRSASEIIERQARHMTRLVDDIIDVSRISRRRVVLRRQRLALDGPLAAAIEATRPGIEARAQRLHVSVPPDPLYVDGDPTRLAQIFGNLLGNAVKYTPQGGHIQVSLAAESGQVVARIRDSGKGVEPSQLEEIFEVFAQGDHSLDSVQDGLGLGLHLARQLVELHGGKIEARSEGAQRGSEFIIRLPQAEAPEPTGPAAGMGAGGEHEASAAKGLRLLVADDNADVRRSLAMLLECDGHEVHMAGDGEEAVAVAARVQPDLILLDIGMPKLNGYDAARRIRQLAGGDAIHLVALTGWGNAEDRQRARDAGFDQHWTKPLEYSTLRAAIQRVAADSDGASRSNPGS